MPLIAGKSKKAFDSNLKTELKAGKPKDQALAISYAVQKRNRKKKMAYGGDVNDKDSIANNSGKRPLEHSDWTDNVTVEQAQRPSPTPLSRPSGKYRNDRPEEDSFMSSDAPGGYGKQPRKSDDDDGADRQGPSISDMQRQHNNGRMPYARGGEVDLEHGQPSEEEMIMQDASKLAARMVRKMYAEGGMLRKDKGIELEERYDEHDLQSSARPSEDEGKDFAMSRNESEDYGMRSGRPDDSAPHSIAEEIRLRKRYAEGGRTVGDIIGYPKAEGGMLDSGSEDEDEAEMYAEGGEVDIRDNQREFPNGYYPRNEDGVLKEIYGEDGEDQPLDSNEHGDELSDEDSHDMIGRIRKKMKKSSISR